MTARKKGQKLPLTDEQKERQKLEGSLRRRFDHYITRLSPEKLAELGHLWVGVELMTDAVLESALDHRDAPGPDASRKPEVVLPLPSWLTGFLIRGGTPEARCGGLHLAPRVFQWPAAAELVASVPAHRAREPAAVHRPQIQQFEPEVRPFAYYDHVVDLTRQEPARYPVIADVAHRAVLRVHQGAQFLPPETAPAHRGHNRKDRVMAAEAPVKPDVDKATRDAIDDAGKCKCQYGEERECRIRCRNEMTGGDGICSTCRRLIAGELPPDGHCHAMIAGMG